MREHEIIHAQLQPGFFGDLAYPEAVLPDRHLPFCASASPEGLVCPAVYPDKGPVTLQRRVLVFGAGRIELNDRFGLAVYPQTSDRLSAVCVKGPHRDPVFAGQTGKKA